MDKDTLIKVLAQFGFPSVFLGLVLWFLVKPITDSYIQNINAQTRLLGEMSQDLKDLKQDIFYIKNNQK